MGWQPNPYIAEGEAAASLPGGLGAGRPAAGRPVPRDLSVIFCRLFFADKPLRPAAGRPGPDRPAAGRPGYISVNFESKNVFL